MKKKGTRYTQKEINELTSMYGEGTSVYKICKVLNHSETSVKNHLKRLGVYVQTEVADFKSDEFSFRWLYWVIIPLWIIDKSTNPLDSILYLISE